MSEPKVRAGIVATGNLHCRARTAQESGKLRSVKINDCYWLAALGSMIGREVRTLMKESQRRVFLAAVLAAGCITAISVAQAPDRSGFGAAAGRSHPGDAVPDLQALPGDRLPPFGMLDQNGQLKPQPARPPAAPAAPAPAGGNVAARPHSDVPAPPLEIAIEGARAAIADCVTRGRRGGVAVVDSAGEARVMMTADGEDGSHVFVAQRKTLTALEFKMTSAEARDAVAKDPSLIARVTPAMFVMFGAIPITQRGQIIGAIGYSGGDDVNCATAGWKVIQSRLPQ